jgi:hypothetical protein
MPMIRPVRMLPDILINPKFQKLLKYCINPDEAIGKLVRFYWCAASYYGEKGRYGSAIPSLKFADMELGELIDAGFAKVIENGDVRAAGDADLFSWMMTKIESGSAGGKAKNEKEKQKLEANSSSAIPNASDAIATSSERCRTLAYNNNNNNNNKSPLPPNGGNEDESSDHASENEEDHKSDPEKSEARRKAVEVLNSWNELCPDLPKVKTGYIAPKRQRAINARCKEMGLEKIRELFKELASWKFGLGDNPKNWKATFDYAMRPDTVEKFENGQYKAAPTEKPQVIERRFKTMVGEDERGAPIYAYR